MPWAGRRPRRFWSAWSASNILLKSENAMVAGRRVWILWLVRGARLKWGRGAWLGLWGRSMERKIWRLKSWRRNWWGALGMWCWRRRVDLLLRRGRMKKRTRLRLWLKTERWMGSGEGEVPGDLQGELMDEGKMQQMMMTRKKRRRMKEKTAMISFRALWNLPLITPGHCDYLKLIYTSSARLKRTPPTSSEINNVTTLCV